ncbi:P2R1A-PPP2R2A-interacting phosphatase regulator 1 [Bacillus rossius redtenbacheri]|uniref:P2R1A-PPP2R2A-interacting phosphatase regulator 1 n=1 Tax=Bacillus rossius redtenbacheri TaxID=93214 RepID=UPI002FDE9506
MDVDSPASLKRSSSAPMINELSTTMSSATTTASTRDALPFSGCAGGSARPRRFSGSFSPVHGAASAGVPPRLTPRVSQLRQEECVHVAEREAAQERELHSTMQMSQSWEEGLNLAELGDAAGRQERRASRVCDPLLLSLPPCSPACSSPSPTRQGLGRQCFSPGVQALLRTSPSPSPTRKGFSTTRSSSPIAMRPSSLGPVKRKFQLDDDKAGDQYLSPPAKRPSFCGSERGGGGLLMTHSGRLDATASPLPGSLSSVGTPESLSSADSPGFAFHPVDSPSPGRSDEPMQEDRPLELPKPDEVMSQSAG